MIASFRAVFLLLLFRKLGPKEGVVSASSHSGQDFTFISEEKLGDESDLFSSLLLIIFGLCLDSKRSDDDLVAADSCPALGVSVIEVRTAAGMGSIDPRIPH